MYNTNKKSKIILNSLFNLLVIIIILFNRSSMAFGASHEWIEVSKTSDGIQYLDVSSLNIKRESVIEITTKYSKLDADTSEIIENNIYVMRINCITNKFKDVSVNGKKKLTAKWEDPNGDKLLDDVISDSCKNV